MSLVYGVVQFNIHVHDLPLFLLLTLQIKRAFSDSPTHYESSSQHQQHRVNTLDCTKFQCNIFPHVTHEKRKGGLQAVLNTHVMLACTS